MPMFAIGDIRRYIIDYSIDIPPHPFDFYGYPVTALYNSVVVWSHTVIH